MMQNKATFPTILAVVFTVFFIALAINPVNRTVWFAEIIPVVVVFVLLVVTKKQFQFSNTAYGFMAFWLFWHTIGGHYTFANVPFDWFNQWFEGDRNHFDRVGHLSIGFYAYAMVEWLLRKKYTGIVVANFFSLFMVMSIAAGYEIIEWWYAVAQGGDAGIEFLGSQGDIWDAQKDMLADTIGAVLSLVVFNYLHINKQK